MVLLWGWTRQRGLTNGHGAKHTAQPHKTNRCWHTESIQQAWLKVRARSNVRLAGERDARLEHICWRVWTMRRKAAALAAAPRPSIASDDGGLAGVGGALHEDDGAGGGGAGGGASGGGAAVDDDELRKLYFGAHAPPGAGLPARLKRLSIPPRGGAGGAALGELLSESSDEPPPSGAATEAPGTPSLAGGSPRFLGFAAAARGGGAAGGPAHEAAAGAAAGAAVGANLGPDRVPKLYCVLISMHGLVRGERMELGRDPDTGGQVGGCMCVCVCAAARCCLLLPTRVAGAVPTRSCINPNQPDQPQQQSMFIDHIT